MLLRFVHNLPLLIVVIMSGFALLMTVEASREVRAHGAYMRAIADVEVVAPRSYPEQNQDSVEMAMVMFSIERPLTVEGPDFDPMLIDRGLTTGGLLLPQKTVSVGPAAFTSWAVLGSTLAHEIEVHVPQSFLKVVATDQIVQMSMSARRFVGQFFPLLKPSAKELFENDGTWAAERAAYMHEINNAKRFGLSDDELQSIWRVMDYYYPNRKQAAREDSHFSASSDSDTQNPAEHAIRASDL